MLSIVPLSLFSRLHSPHSLYLMHASTSDLIALLMKHRCPLLYVIRLTSLRLFVVH